MSQFEPEEDFRTSSSATRDLLEEKRNGLVILLTRKKGKKSDVLMYERVLSGVIGMDGMVYWKGADLPRLVGSSPNTKYPPPVRCLSSVVRGTKSRLRVFLTEEVCDFLEKPLYGGPRASRDFRNILERSWLTEVPSRCCSRHWKGAPLLRLSSRVGVVMFKDWLEGCRVLCVPIKEEEEAVVTSSDVVTSGDAVTSAVGASSAAEPQGCEVTVKEEEGCDSMELMPVLSEDEESLSTTQPGYGFQGEMEMNLPSLNMFPETIELRNDEWWHCFTITSAYRVM